MKRNWLGLIITGLVGVCLLITAADAARRDRPARKWPRGCKTVGYQFQAGQLILDPQVEDSDQTVYLIGNRSRGRLLVKFKEQEYALIHPNWQTEINYNRFSAFATDEKNIHFTCQKIHRGKVGDKVDCGETLKICQYPRAKFAEHNLGNYWITHNQSLNQAVRAIIRRGVLLRW